MPLGTLCLQFIWCPGPGKPRKGGGILPNPLRHQPTAAADLLARCRTDTGSKEEVQAAGKGCRQQEGVQAAGRGAGSPGSDAQGL